MSLRGLAIVGITIASICLVDTMMVIQANEALGADYGDLSEKISTIFRMLPVAFILGTVMTLGLPWIIGALLSSMFADSPDD